MSIYDKASLVQIPSGVKSGTLYNVVPNTADGDFDFTRGSSATRVNKDGLIETVASGVPRLDYPLLDGVVQDCPALLLEPTRTNLLLRSEELDNGSWTKSGSTVTANQIVSPNGSQTADLITATSGNHINVYQAATTTNADYNYSVFLKKGNTNIIEPYIFEVGVGFKTKATIDFDNETATITNGTVILEKHSNDWYRVLITINLTSASFTFGIFTNSTVGTRTVYAWGAQVEQGSYATSYIPTSGQIETRSADVCNNAQADFNDSEGVLYANIAALANDGTHRQTSINDDSTSDRVMINLHSTSNQIQGFVFDGFVEQADLRYTVNDTTLPNKIALKYKVNDCALWVNGFEVDTDTVATMPSGLQKFNFDSGNGGANFYGKTKELMTFNEALTDSELETLTSWDSFNEMAKALLYTIE